MDACSKLKFTNEDRISSLPDCLLTDILSRLPTKFSVLTSVLSKRWLHLWTSIHNLDFDNRLYLKRDNCYKDDDEVFESFVKSVISRCTSENFLKFRLVCPGQEFSVSLLQDWLQNVADRNVQYVEIDSCKTVVNDSSKSCALQLPNNLFTCKSLVSLKLSLEKAFDLPALSNYFPSLKRLHISLMFPSTLLAEKLFSICPVLEILKIDFAPGNDTNLTFNISASRLKKLWIDVWADGENTEYQFVMDTPQLGLINVTDKNLACCMKAPLHHLDKAILDLGNDEHLSMGFDYDRNQLVNVQNLIGAFSSTKYLSLSSQTTMALHLAEHHGKIPCFPNLTTLKLELYDFMVAKLMPKFLRGCPELEVLILMTERHDQDKNYKRPFKWMTSSEPPFDTDNLQTVKILSFSERDIEWNLAEYFLREAQTLQKLVVQAEERKRSVRLKISDKLSNLIVASEDCVIKVV